MIGMEEEIPGSGAGEPSLVPPQLALRYRVRAVS